MTPAAAVTAIHELQRRSFENGPVPLEQWAAYDWQRDIEIEMLENGEIEDMDGWVETSESEIHFASSGWVAKDREAGAVRMDRGADTIYIAPLSETFITFLDRA